MDELVAGDQYILGHDPDHNGSNISSCVFSEDYGACASANILLWLRLGALRQLLSAAPANRV